MIFKRTLRLVQLLVLSSMSVILINAQTEVPQVIETKGGSTCEFVAAVVDGFTQRIPREKNIIVIGTKGRHERGSVFDQRLNFIRSYLTEYPKGTPYERSVNSVIVAAAQSGTDLGQLDFYVDGNVKLRIVFRKNARLALSPCYHEP